MLNRDPLQAVPPVELRTHHKTSILDLPEDVLSDIFDYFRGDIRGSKISVGWWYIHYRKHRNDIALRQTIRNSRLVCRLFHDLASPLLCPVLRVALNEASLDRANKISHSPRLAASIRGIEVVLHYRPKELAADLSRFKALRQSDLEAMDEHCDYHLETWFVGDHDVNDETICPLPHRQYQKGMRQYQRIRAAWSQLLGEREKEDEDEDSLEYQRILLQGHEAYQKKHEEQFRLITDGSFVNCLAESMSRMINADSLSFIDKIEQIPNPYFEDPTLVLTNMEELRQFMTRPHDWETIEGLEGSPEVLPARLLSDLPIAIHKAGVKLREVNFGCFPSTKTRALVSPDRQDPSNPAWPDLCAACQSISRFEIGIMQSFRIRHDYLPAEQQSVMDQYLGAMLSGQCVEEVELNFYLFGINDGRGNTGNHRIGKLLEAVVSPRIRKLKVMGCIMSQNELEQFCTGLGYGLTSLFFYNMELSSGSWADTLDILRDRIGTRFLEGRCEFGFSNLSGGEFGQLHARAVSDNWDGRMRLVAFQALTAANDYVSGVGGTVNPLR